MYHGSAVFMPTYNQRPKDGSPRGELHAVVTVTY